MVQYRIQNLLHLLQPYIKSNNPNYNVVDAEGVAWIDSSSLSDVQKMEFRQAELAYFVARCYPELSVGPLHIARDYLAETQLIETLTDTTSTTEAQKWADTFIKAFNRTLGEVEGPAAIIKYLADKVLNAVEEPYQSFIVKGSMFLARSIVQEALDRENPTTDLTVEGYLKSRRGTVDILPFLAIGRWMHYLDISPEVLKHPDILKLQEQTGDLVFLANDLYSYKKEFFEGTVLHNYVSVALRDPITGLHEKDRQGAIDYTCRKFAETLADFLRRKEALPSFGETEDAKVALYTTIMMDLIIGNIHWSLFVERYGHYKAGTMDGPTWGEAVFDMDPL